MALNVIKTVRVNPAPNSSDNSVNANTYNLPLTFFDIHWIKFHPNQRVIFYKLNESSSPESFHTLIIPKLSLSLSFVLGHYRPLAGRLTWDPRDPKPFITVSENDTVSLTIAETKLDFSFACGYGNNGLRPATVLHPLVPDLTVSDDSSTVFSLQITLFPNQGFSIGVASHHSVLDGSSATLFLKAWAHICRSHHDNGKANVDFFPLLPQDLTPVFDRTVVNVPRGLETKMIDLLTHLCKGKDNFRSLKPPTMNEISDNVIRVTLELTPENIEKLRERVENISTRSPHELHLSTFVLSYAYAWTCVVRARGGNAERPVRFLYAVDFRKRLNPKVPSTYFGSCVFAMGWFQYEAGVFLGEDGFYKAVEILSDSVKSLGTSGIETICENYIEGFKGMKPNAQVGSVAGSTRLGVYEVDFGWGRPCKTEVLSIDRNEAFSMSERRDEPGGVEMGLCLKKSEMESFLSLFNNGLKD
ncbi:unnamed protein product [Cochlearia groenlandica]